MLASDNVSRFIWPVYTIFYKIPLRPFTRRPFTGFLLRVCVYGKDSILCIKEEDMKVCVNVVRT